MKNASVNVVGAQELPIDVLMTTYAGETPEFLAQSLESLYSQTVLFERIVLVLDGYIPEEQMAVIRRFQVRPRPELLVVPLKENVGPGAASIQGLAFCRAPWIARMDSDDISSPERLEKEWALVERDPSVDVVFTWQGEFTVGSKKLVSIKMAPPDHAGIARALRWRNLIAHGSIIVRRAALDKIGGYSPFRVLEDYDLYLRLISAGAIFACVQEPLLSVRVTPEQRARRSGLKYVVREWQFRWRCYRRGNFGLFIFFASSVMYTVFRLIPPSVKPVLYKLVRKGGGSVGT